MILNYGRGGEISVKEFGKTHFPSFPLILGALSPFSTIISFAQRSWLVRHCSGTEHTAWGKRELPLS